jgi:hypothetical protein
MNSSSKIGRTFRAEDGSNGLASNTFEQEFLESPILPSHLRLAHKGALGA